MNNMHINAYDRKKITTYYQIRITQFLIGQKSTENKKPATSYYKDMA